MTQENKFTAGELEALQCGLHARTAVIFHLPTIIASGSFPDEFYRLLTEDDALDDIFPFVKNYLNEDNCCDLNARWAVEESLLECFQENLQKCYGFIVRFECPIFDNGLYSWGYYKAEYAQLSTFDEIVKYAEDFGDRMFEAGKSKARGQS